MSNMSYCRFRNTRSDLRDCRDNMGTDNLSYDEFRARRTLILLCVEIADDYRLELEKSMPSRDDYEARAKPRITT